MKLSVKRIKNNKEITVPYNDIPDDYRLDELYADLYNVEESVSDEELCNQMKNSKSTLLGESSGKTIRFSDYANNTTLLSDLGINSSETFQLNDVGTTNDISGAL